MSSCENCKRVLTEVEELRNMVKSLESTVKNLSTLIKSLTSSNSDFYVINKRRRTSNVSDSQIGPVPVQKRILPILYPRSQQEHYLKTL